MNTVLPHIPPPKGEKKEKKKAWEIFPNNKSFLSTTLLNKGVATAW